MEKGIDYIGVTVVFLCHDGKGNYLFNKRGKNCRDEQGRWDPGGGGVDFAEPVEDALRREVKEEYGTEVLSHEFLGYRDIHRLKDGKKTHWIGLVFKVLVESSKVKNCEPHKFDDLQWFSLDNLPSPLHSQFLKTLRMFKDRL